MNWLEISVQVDGEAAEAVSEVFNRYSRGGAVIEEIYSSDDSYHYDAERALTVKTYLPLHDETAAGGEERQQLEEALWHLSQLYPIPPPRLRTLTEEDWTQAWKKAYQPLRVGERIVIVPSWQTYHPHQGEVIIKLDPGMAFGTGLHPTTRMCLTALERYLQPGQPSYSGSVLDLGTGSGILAIVAAKLGVASVLALDIDPVAVEAAQANAAANGLEEVIAIKQGALERVSGDFSLMVINILAETIVELVEGGLMEYLKPVGLLIAAGIIEEREAMVTTALKSQRITLIERLQEKDWITLVGRKEGMGIRG